MTERVEGLCNVNLGGGKLCAREDRHAGAHAIDAEVVEARPVAKPPAMPLTYGELAERLALLEKRVDELEARRS